VAADEDFDFVRRAFGRFRFRSFLSLGVLLSVPSISFSTPRAHPLPWLPNVYRDHGHDLMSHFFAGDFSASNDIPQEIPSLFLWTSRDVRVSAFPP
jgi:hypothetical protein